MAKKTTPRRPLSPATRTAHALAALHSRVQSLEREQQDMLREARVLAGIVSSLSDRHTRMDADVVDLLTRLRALEAGAADG